MNFNGFSSINHLGGSGNNNNARITIGTINGGTRANIVPDNVVMTGTIRTYDEKVRAQVGRDVKLTAEKIADAMH